MFRRVALVVVLAALSARAQEAVPPEEKGAIDDAPGAAASTEPARPLPPGEPPPPPLWRNPWVAERAPNIYGQTGVVRVESARAGKGGQFDVALNARYFFLPDYIAPGVADQTELVSGLVSGGFTLFDIAEIGIASDYGAAINPTTTPNALLAFGNFYPSLKLGFTLLPVAFGVDVRGHIPSQLQLVEKDFTNFAVASTALFTVDLYEGLGIPLKLHLNGGYTYQNGNKFSDKYYLQGVTGAMQSMIADVWYYDHAHYGVAVEVPLPFVTPYVEYFGQTALFVPPNEGAGRAQDYNYLADSVMIVTPGLRGTLGRGLAIDLAVDVGLTGNGSFTPDLTRVVFGQPLNPVYAVRAGFSFTFDPYAPQSAPAASVAASSSSGGEPPPPSSQLGRLEGCVTDEAGNGVQGAVVSVVEAGARLATDDQGCFALPATAAGLVTVAASGADIEPVQAQASVVASDVVKVDLKTRRTSKIAHVGGVVITDGDEALEASVEALKADGSKASVKATGGLFDVEAPPGPVQLLVKVEGYLLQGARLVVEPGVRASHTFVMKRVPKKRAASLTKDHIEPTTIVPFEFGKARLLKAAEFILDDVADLLLANPGIELVRVEGFPEQGGEGEAPELPLARAQAVVDYLVGRGVAPSRLAAAAGPPEQKGRRIEFVIAKETGERAVAAAPAAAPAPEEEKSGGKKGKKKGK